MHNQPVCNKPAFLPLMPSTILALSMILVHMILVHMVLALTHDSGTHDSGTRLHDSGTHHDSGTPNTMYKLALPGGLQLFKNALHLLSTRSIQNIH